MNKFLGNTVKCPACGHELRLLFNLYSCDYCTDSNKMYSYVVIPVNPEWPLSLGLFRERTDAERFLHEIKTIGGFTKYTIAKVSVEYTVKWVEHDDDRIVYSEIDFLIFDKKPSIIQPNYAWIV